MLLCVLDFCFPSRRRSGLGLAEIGDSPPLPLDAS